MRHVFIWRCAIVALACTVAVPIIVEARIRPIIAGDIGSGKVTALNDHGQLAGYANFGAGTRAFSWTGEGGYVDLAALLAASLPGGAILVSSEAMAVANDGTVFGSEKILTLEGNTNRPFHWNAATGLVRIELPSRTSEFWLYDFSPESGRPVGVVSADQGCSSVQLRPGAPPQWHCVAGCC